VKAVLKSNIATSRNGQTRRQQGFATTMRRQRRRMSAKRITSLANRLGNEKIHYENGNETEWYRTVRSLQDDIRFDMGTRC
jgi:hypothetical protein